MSSLFAFRCWIPESKLATSALVVFCGLTRFAEGDFQTAISNETKRSLAPDAVLILIPAAQLDRAKELLTSDHSAFSPLLPGTTIGLYIYDNHGTVSYSASIRGDRPAEELPLKDIRRQGLTTIFRRRGGLLESGPTAHFVKPSQTADTRFLRASHALAEGVEIFFVALWILPSLTDDIRYIHIDTSSIASVVFAALLMKSSELAPVIRSFNSYEGLATHPFSLDRPDLVLISASQSGGMARDISIRVADPSRVITLFTTADAPGRTRILCDLRRDPDKNFDGFDPAEAISPSDLERSRPIRLIGEHFIAAALPPKSVLVTTKHPPSNVKTALATLAGAGVFRSYKPSQGSAERRGVWVDVAALLKNAAFRDALKQFVARSVPATTRATIYFDADASSKQLAEAVVAEVGRQGGELRGLRIMALSEAEKGKASWTEPKSPVLIVSGATGHGAELLSASRALRDYAPHSHRVYFATAAMPSSREAYRLLKANLEHGGHTFLPMFELFLDRGETARSWDEESKLLLEFEEELPAELRLRLDHLDRSSGLQDNLFLSSGKGALRLRDNFAFWPHIENSSKGNQADVFVTVCCILENLRTGDISDAPSRLINDVQTHTVLAPETFSRYNDGVIQAAFIRAARPVELNYCDSAEFSKLMAGLILEMSTLNDQPQGEALSEFLVALCTGRMSLEKSEYKRLRDKLTTMAANLSEAQKFLVEKLPPSAEA